MVVLRSRSPLLGRAVDQLARDSLIDIIYAHYITTIPPNQLNTSQKSGFF